MLTVFIILNVLLQILKSASVTPSFTFTLVALDSISIANVKYCFISKFNAFNVFVIEKVTTLCHLLSLYFIRFRLSYFQARSHIIIKCLFAIFDRISFFPSIVSIPVKVIPGFEAKVNSRERSCVEFNVS